MNISTVPQDFPYGQTKEDIEEVTSTSPPISGWNAHFQSFTPYQEHPTETAPSVMDGKHHVYDQHSAPNKRRKGYTNTDTNTHHVRDLAIDTMTMSTANEQSRSRPHKPTRRSKSKKPSASTTGLSSPTSQSTISSFGSGSAAPDSLPEDYDSEQDHPPAASSSSTSKQSHNARTRHNMVEQKYRHRLNTHFDKLLEVLPSGAVGDSRQSYTQPGGVLLGEGPSLERERKVSKAEVLDRARLYIQTLENEHVRLQQEREELRGLWEGYYERAAAMRQGTGLHGGQNGGQ